MSKWTRRFFLAAAPVAVAIVAGFTAPLGASSRADAAPDGCCRPENCPPGCCCCPECCEPGTGCERACESGRSCEGGCPSPEGCDQAPAPAAPASDTGCCG